MALATDDIVSQLISSLESEKYTKTLTYTTKVLDENSIGDEQQPLSDELKKTIQRVHCRSLIALSKYGQVCEYYTMNTSTNAHIDTSDTTLVLEYAYALYKLGRYVQCRDFVLEKVKQRNNSSANANDSANAGISSKLDKMTLDGLMHVLAQSQYKLHETKGATQTYTDILKSSDADGHGNGAGDDDDEVLTNALAVQISNMSIATNQNQHSSEAQNLIEEKAMSKMKKIEAGNNNDNNNDDYLYEVVYNTATHHILQSSSHAQTKKAIDWLMIAEQKCKDEYSYEGDDGDDEEKKTLMNNIMPIQANIALGKMQLGDLNGSTRSYLELVLSSKKIHEYDSSFTGGGALLTADNNLAVLNSRRGTSCSVFDLLKRLPDLNAVAVDNTKGTDGVRKVTPNQIRIILYNRAILFYKMNKYTECKSVLVSLKKSLSNLGNNDSHFKNGTKKKRKKGKNVKSTEEQQGQQITNIDMNMNMDNHGIPPAPPSSDAEIMLWESRIALLENEINTSKKNNDTTKNSDSDNNGIIDQINRIKFALEKATAKGEQKYVLEYALAEMMLFQAQKVIDDTTTNNNNNDPMSSKDVQSQYATILEELPLSLRKRPATIATLCSLYGRLGMDDKVEKMMETKDEGIEDDDDDDNNNNLVEYKELADFKLRLGMYREAAKIYESILEELEKGNVSLNEDEEMECKAGLVKAMSYFDIERAVAYAEQSSLFDDDNESEEIDGEELEAMEIPQLSKGSSGSNRMRKLLGSHRAGEEKQKKSKNHEAILRRRAKKREIYLEKLQQEGKYNPDRPLKPDPERWIPKNQRSYSKRGRKGRTKFVGAQGIGAGAGADRDAAKLDAAARAAAKAQGKDIGGSGPSTAHLAVSSNGPIGKSGRRR